MKRYHITGNDHSHPQDPDGKRFGKNDNDADDKKKKKQGKGK